MSGILSGGRKRRRRPSVSWLRFAALGALGFVIVGTLIRYG